MQGKKDYNEKLFISFQLSQYVPENNFYRKLKNALDLNFVTQQTRKYYGIEGQRSIDPEVFFKLMLVGYLENINSDRKIIEHASMRLDIRFFLGYDLDEHLPWHSTLSRTRKLYGEELFQSLFLKMVSFCTSKGMIPSNHKTAKKLSLKTSSSKKSILSQTPTRISPLTKLE